MNFFSKIKAAYAAFLGWFRQPSPLSLTLSAIILVAVFGLVIAPLFSLTAAIVGFGEFMAFKAMHWFAFVAVVAWAWGRQRRDQEIIMAEVLAVGWRPDFIPNRAAFFLPSTAALAVAVFIEILN